MQSSQLIFRNKTQQNNNNILYFNEYDVDSSAQSKCILIIKINRRLKYCVPYGDISINNIYQHEFRIHLKHKSIYTTKGIY